MLCSIKAEQKYFCYDFIALFFTLTILASLCLRVWHLWLKIQSNKTCTQNSSCEMMKSVPDISRWGTWKDGQVTQLKFCFVHSFPDLHNYTLHPSSDCENEQTDTAARWETHLCWTHGNTFLPDMFASEIKELCIIIIKIALHSVKKINK